MAVWPDPENVTVCWANGAEIPADGLLATDVVSFSMNDRFADYPEFAIHFTWLGLCQEGQHADLRLAFRSSNPLLPVAAPPASPDLLVFDLDSLVQPAGPLHEFTTVDTVGLEALALGEIAMRSGASSPDVVVFDGSSIRLPRASVLELREQYTAPFTGVAYASAHRDLAGRGAWLGVGNLPASDELALLGRTLGSIFVAGDAQASVVASTQSGDSFSETLTSLSPGDLQSFEPADGTSVSLTPLAHAESRGAAQSAGQWLGAGIYGQGDLPLFAGGHVDELHVPPGLSASLCVPLAGCTTLPDRGPVDLSTPGSRLFLEPAVTAFAEAYFGGARVDLRPGRFYRPADLAAIGGVIGSLVVPPGLEATVGNDGDASALDWANGEGDCVRASAEAGGATSLPNIYRLSGVSGLENVMIAVQPEPASLAPISMAACPTTTYVLSGTACGTVFGLGGIWQGTPGVDASTCSYDWSSLSGDPPDIRGLLEATSASTASPVCAPDWLPNDGPGSPGCQACDRYLPDSAGQVFNPVTGASL